MYLSTLILFQALYFLQTSLCLLSSAMRRDEKLQFNEGQRLLFIAGKLTNCKEEQVVRRDLFGLWNIVDVGQSPKPGWPALGSRGHGLPAGNLAAGCHSMSHCHGHAGKSWPRPPHWQLGCQLPFNVTSSRDVVASTGTRWEAMATASPLPIRLPAAIHCHIVTRFLR